MVPNEEYPSVTIIMPVRNEADFIERSLSAVLSQDYPPDKIEVLIADGMSDDGTVEIIQSLPGADRVQIIPNPERIQAHGLNRVIPLARGKYIIRVDGHTIIMSDYVYQCVKALQETGADNVGGAMDPLGATLVGKAISAAGKSPFAVPGAFHVSKTAQYTDTVYLGAWSQDVFERVGLFNTDLAVNEDYELNYRIRANGGTIYFTPTIKSVYYNRQNWSHLGRQYYRYGRSKIKTLKLYPKSLRIRQIVAPLFAAGLICTPILAVFIPILLLLWFAEIVAYLTLSLMFAFRAKVGTDTQVGIWRIMVSFFIMHAAWGLGFWRELIKSGPL